MSLHILMVNEFFSFGDGSSLYIANVSQALIERGHRVSTLYGTKRDREIHHPEIPSYYVPDIFGFNYVNSRKGMRQIRESILSCSPDIIYIHQVLNPYVIELCAMLAPTIRYEHGFRLSCPTGRRDARRVDRICRFPFSWKCMFRAHTQKCMPRNPFLAFRRIRDVYQHIAAHNGISRILVASGYVRDLLVTSGLNPGLVEIIPYFTALPGENARQIGNTPCVLFVGRMEYEKGPEFLMAALSRIDTPLQAVFAGEGPELEKLKTMAQAMPRHNIVFPGWVDNADLARFYRRADLLVVPSIWPEPFGIIGIEAMSYSLPVVAFDVGGISEWLENGVTGFLVERKDTVGLSETIARVLADSPLARRLGRQGRKAVEEKFTVDVHLERLTGVFRDASMEKTVS